MRHLICQLLDISERSYYTFKKQERPIIGLLEKYFTKEDLEEFLKTGEIKKFEKTDFLQKEVIEKNRLKYLHSFTTLNPYQSISSSHNEFIELYFSFLNFLSNKSDFYQFDFQYLLSQYLLESSLRKQQEYLSSDEYKQAYQDNLILLREDGADNFENEKLAHIITQDSFKTQILVSHNDLYKHFRIFKEWDSYMLIFIQECFETNFEILLNDTDPIKYQKEAAEHIERYRNYIISKSTSG